jgi:hypothetical protein
MSQSIVVKAAGDIVPARPLGDLAELSQILERLRTEDAAFVLTPVARVDFVKPFHQISLRSVWIDPTIAMVDEYSGHGPHCYFSKKYHGDVKKGVVSLGKGGLLALLAAAGANPVLRRQDDQSRPHYRDYEAILYHQDFDGAMRQYPGHRDLDLSEGSDEIKGMSPARLAIDRHFLNAKVQTLAIEAAVRNLFAILGSYNVSDLKRKPFIVPKLVQVWDISDPDQKRAAIQQTLANEGRLFGALPPAERSMVTVPELSEANGDKTPPPPPTTTKAAEPPKKDAEIQQTSAPLDEELPDFDTPSLVVCGCACGCQREVTPGDAEKSKAKLGGVIRCPESCYPSRTFDYEAHKTLKSLGIPRWPTLTADEVRAKWAAATPGGSK